MSKFLSRWMWNRALKCVVEIQRRGCFEEGTVMMKLPDDRVVQGYIADLEDYDTVMARADYDEAA